MPVNTTALAGGGVAGGSSGHHGDKYRKLANVTVMNCRCCQGWETSLLCVNEDEVETTLGGSDRRRHCAALRRVPNELFRVA